MHLVGFIIRIYHDARSPERQTEMLLIYIYIYIYILICLCININNIKRSIVATRIIGGTVYSWHNKTVSGNSTICRIRHNIVLYVYCPIYFYNSEKEKLLYLQE